MKKILLAAVVMVMSLAAKAQNEVGQITLKPLVGINLANVTDIDDADMRVGLAAGVEAEFGIAEKFGVTAGAIYSMQGIKDGKLDYINIPILANYYVIPGLAIKAGIQPAFKVSAKYSYEENDMGDIEKGDGDLDGVKGFDLSIPVGVSYEYNNFVLDARYNFGVTKVADWSKSKNSVFQITLGYKFSL